MASPLKFQEEFLTCGICFEVFNEPKVLPCLHTFCQSCLAAFINSTTLLDKRTGFQCPTCRELVHAPRPHEKDWASQFRNNFYVNNLIDSNYPTTPTSVSTPSHENPCPTHSNPIELFCVDCNKMICVQCSVVSHRSCRQIIPIHKIATEKRSLLTAYKSTIDIPLSRYKDSLVEVEREKQNVLFQKGAITTIIKKKGEEMMKLVASEMAACLDQIETIANENRLILDKEYESKNQTISKLSELSDSFDKLIKGADNHVLDGIDSVLENREKIMKELPLKIEIPVFKTNFKERETKLTIGELNKESGRRALIFPEKSPTQKIPTTSDEQTAAQASSPFFRLRNLNLDIEFKSNIKGDKYKPCLRDITHVSGDVLVVTDYANQKIKSFYRHGKEWNNSQASVSVPPHSIAKIGNLGVTIAVTLPKAKQIVMATVNPNIIIQKLVSTPKRFWGITSIGKTNFAVSTCPGTEPGTISIIDIEGHELKVLNHTFLSNPLYLTSLSSGDILASDCTLGRIVKLRQNGELLFLTDKKETTLEAPMGMATDLQGAIFVADAKSLLVLNESGQVKNNLNLRFRKDQKIRSVSVSAQYVYVVTEANMILVYNCIM